jgi:hypothetical protein
MEVRVVDQNVGDDADLERHIGNPLKDQTMGGDFDNRNLCAGLHHFEEELLQFRRVRGGHGWGFCTVADLAEEAADQAIRDAGCFKDSSQHKGRCCLSIGLCDSDVREFSRWKAEPQCGGGGEDAKRLGDRQAGDRFRVLVHPLAADGPGSSGDSRLVLPLCTLPASVWFLKNLRRHSSHIDFAPFEEGLKFSPNVVFARVSWMSQQ